MLLLGAGPLLSACHSEDAEPCDCPGIGGPAKWNPYIEPPVSGPDSSYHQPSYDPTNGQRLVYRRDWGADRSYRPSLAPRVGLWVGSTAGGRPHPLLRGYDLLYAPSFGPGGWVAFQRAGQVWKAKANGDSLRQLTYASGPHYMPSWSPDGSRLLCQEPEGRAGNHLILDKNGKTIRSIRLVNTRYALAWAPDGNSILVEYSPTGRDMSLATYNLTNGQLDVVTTSPAAPDSYGFVYGAAWLPDGKSIVWCGDLGLYRTDLATRRTVRLRSGCQGRRYENPAVAPDGRQLAVERTDRHVSGDGYSMHTTTNIWTMDPDGRNERQVTF